MQQVRWFFRNKANYCGPSFEMVFFKSGLSGLRQSETAEIQRLRKGTSLESVRTCESNAITSRLNIIKKVIYWILFPPLVTHLVM